MTFPIITICGSLRAGRALWDKVANDLSEEGYIVLTVHIWDWDGLHSNRKELKKMLDDMYKAKILMSEGIFVINKGGYVGPSTKDEIEFATDHGKFIRFLENHGPEG